jgi:hypothetical protein
MPLAAQVAGTPHNKNGHGAVSAARVAEIMCVPYDNNAYSDGSASG